MARKLVSLLFISIAIHAVLGDRYAQDFRLEQDTLEEGAFTAGHARRMLLAKKKKEKCPRMLAPYVVSIRDLTGNHNCGGVVIAPDAVLTSASCVDRRLKRSMAEKPMIHIGGTDSNKPVQKRMAERIIIHERWTGNALYGYDLAILKLNKATCVLPVKYIGKRKKEQDTFLVFGYGRTGSRGKFSASILHGANVTFVRRKECNERFKLPTRAGWKEACFQSTTGGAGICAGDEGGPILHAPFSPVYEDSLIAIASYTVGACDDTNSVAVATNIRRFRKWIRRILRSDEFRGRKSKRSKKKVPSGRRTEAKRRGRKATTKRKN